MRVRPEKLKRTIYIALITILAIWSILAANGDVRDKIVSKIKRTYGHAVNGKSDYRRKNIRTDFRADVSGREETERPARAISILTFGQSNSANWIMEAPVKNENRNLINYYDGKYYVLNDPLLGATGENRSIWSYLAEKLYEKYDTPIVVLSYGVGGSALWQWLPENDETHYLENMLSDALTYPDEIKYVVFHQGETDALLKTSFKEYSYNLSKTFEYVQTRLPGVQTFLLFGASKCSQTPDGYAPVVNAQKFVGEKRNDTIFVYNTDLLGDEYRWKDGCHFSGKGAEAIADITVDYIKP